MPLDRWLDDAVMQAIAAENNLAETAFTVPSDSDDADYELRWFTPAVEVAVRPRDPRRRPHPDRPASGPVRTQSGILTVTRDGRIARARHAGGARSSRGGRARTVRGARRQPGETVRSPRRQRQRHRACWTTRRRCAPCSPISPRWPSHPYLVIVTAPGDEQDIASRVFVAYARHRRGPGDRLGARRAGALLGQAARPRQLHRAPGEQAHRHPALPAAKATASCSAAIARR